jgi:F-type H+-transporting ATPase subunit delta
MAELATIARPYAEALFKSGANGDARALADQLDALGHVARSPALRQFADNPTIEGAQGVDVMTSALQGTVLSPLVANLLRAMLDNGRLAALPEVAHQYRALVNERLGVSDAIVYSAFPIEPSQMDAVLASLEGRFNRKLNATVHVDPELIGGIRVVVGDEVLDTSVKARLEQMKVALTA